VCDPDSSELEFEVGNTDEKSFGLLTEFVIFLV
jgi:hypothetical protein